MLSFSKRTGEGLSGGKDLRKGITFNSGGMYPKKDLKSNVSIDLSANRSIFTQGTDSPQISSLRSEQTNPVPLHNFASNVYLHKALIARKFHPWDQNRQIQCLCTILLVMYNPLLILALIPKMPNFNISSLPWQDIKLRPMSRLADRDSVSYKMEVLMLFSSIIFVDKNWTQFLEFQMLASVFSCDFICRALNTILWVSDVTWVFSCDFICRALGWLSAIPWFRPEKSHNYSCSWLGSCISHCLLSFAWHSSWSSFESIKELGKKGLKMEERPRLISICTCL